MQPRVSVVIPCYNAERYLAATLDSVVQQDGVELEVIVVDDGSTDGSRRLVAERFPAVKLITQANQGVASARNHGIAKARGEYIAFIDADDIWLPGKLLLQLAVLASQPEAAMVYGAWQVWPSDQPLPEASLLAELKAAALDESRWAGPSGWVYPELLLDCYVWTSTVVARRCLFDRIGMFDTNLRIGEDYDLWLRASRVTPIIRVSRPLALYRIHRNSTTQATAPRDNFQGAVIARAIERWGYESPDGRSASPRLVRRALGRTWREYSWSHLAGGYADEAWRAAKRAIVCEPLSLGNLKLLARAAVRRVKVRPGVR